MSKFLLTNYFRLHSAEQFKESVSESANSIYYVFAGRALPYPDGDDSIPDILNNNETVNIDPYDYMIFGKKVSVNDVKIMVPRHDWTSNTVYSAYRGNTDLSTDKFYAVVNAVSQYHVFKVLDNNEGSPSTIKPDFNETSADDEFYSTSDGYVWKYMYTVDRSTFEKFATSDYIPVVPNANVQGNAVSGAIDVIVVDYRGSNYNTYFSNTFVVSDLAIGGDTTLYNIANNAPTSNNFFNGSYIYIKQGTGMGQIRKIVDYTLIGNEKRIQLDTAFDVTPDSTSVYEITPSVYIVGDGSGAVARALVNTSSSNTISKIEIISRGSGYSYATATVVGNTGGISNSATLNVVLGPKGGHGNDPEYELGGMYVGVGLTFSNNESNTIPVSNDYRTIGLIKDPLFANVELTIADPSGSFEDNELVTQSVSLATGYVAESSASTLTLSNVAGIFVSGQQVTGASSSVTANVISYEINGMTKDFSTFDNRHKFTYSVGSGTLVEDELVYQLFVDTANAYFHSNDANYVYLVHKKGIINSGNTLYSDNSSAYVNLLTYIPPDIVKSSGEVLYIENVNPIDRDLNQSESIKLILKF